MYARRLFAPLGRFAVPGPLFLLPAWPHALSAAALALLLTAGLAACGEDQTAAGADVTEAPDQAAAPDEASAQDQTAAPDQTDPPDQGDHDLSTGADLAGSPDAAADGDDSSGAAGDGAGADAATLPACATVTDCPLAPPCKAWTCSKGQCVPQDAADGKACDDQDLCTQGETCTAGQCQGGGLKSCDDLNACTTDACAPAAGCVHLAVPGTTTCDDGDACTVGDECKAGSCVPGLNTCQCKTHADCGKFEDGNVCNGTLFCDSSQPQSVCKLNPASVVQCPSDQDGPCAKNTCNPTTGQCKLLALSGGTPCDDGDGCTQGDACLDGLCTPGTYVCACKQDADCAVFENGDKCDGTLFCNKANSKCELNPLTIVNCQTVDDTACRKNLCNPKEGKCHLVPVAEGKVCDDANPCTPNETCQAGQCAAAQNTCECQKDADCQGKEDGDLCNGTLYCDAKTNKCVVNPATVVTCGTAGETDCLRSVCNPASGKCALTGQPLQGVACDDGNPCTPNETCQAGQCTAAQNVCECQKDADCKTKEDADLCNGTLYCDLKSFKCLVNPATVVSCPTAFDTPCEAMKCEKKSGKCLMGPVHQGNQCNDDLTCSGGGWCDLGQCLAGESTCQCQTDGDCGKFEDGDKCNGTLYCDKTGKVPSCKVNPATVITCPKVVGAGACKLNLCQPAAGTCQLTAVPGACDDGNACTASDFCKDGGCQGVAKACDDGDACTTDACLPGAGCVSMPKGVSACDDQNACTSDSCDPKQGCQHGYVPVPCEDGNACTVGDTCSGGACAPGKPKTCDDANPCTEDACVAGTGCVSSAVDAPCDDGNACTGPDACKSGKCLGGKVIVCDDSNLCTADGCSPKTGCTTSHVSGACNDGNACTGGDVCKDGACSGTATACDDGNPCTQDACAAKTGCAFTPVGVPCSDGNACTEGDACKDGKCAYIKLLSCDDGNPCTNDGCDPKTGCTHAPGTGSCDDGNACTTKDSCKSGQCLGGAAVCDDQNPCTTDGCDPTQKCLHTANTAECSDGNACTGGDKCAAGQCVGGAKLACDDGNPCTVDGCDAAAGCTQVAGAGSCSDGNACTTADACQGGTCKGQAASCDDGNPCTADTCDPKLGCQNAANTLPCSDGNPCTEGDVCAAGTCKAGKAKVCDDSSVCTVDTCVISTGQCLFTDTSAKTCDDANACTDDACHPALGCGHLNNTKACDDGNPCATNDTCKGGKCLATGVLVCDDGKVCTSDACDPKQGCVYADNTAACDDGVACTVKDVCQLGKCQGALNCDDTNPCTEDACDFKTSACVHSALTGGPCDDANVCTSGETCAAGKCAGGQLKNCDDANACTKDACDSVKSCTYVKLDATACDTDQCTIGDTCVAGVCQTNGKPRYWAATATYLEYYRDRVNGVVALPDGWLGYGGSAEGSNPQADPFGGVGYVVRGDLQGKVLFQKLVNSGGTVLYDIRGGVLESDGNVVLFGNYSNYFLAARVSPIDGKTLAKYTYAQPGVTRLLWRVAEHSGGVGKYLIAGSIENDSTKELDALLLAVKEDFGPSTTYKHPASGKQEFLGITAVPGGDVLAVGYTEEPGVSGSRDGLAVLFAANLTPKVTVKLGGTGADNLWAATVAGGAPAGYVLVGAQTGTGGKFDSWVVRTDASLNVLWSKVNPISSADDEWRDLVALPDGGAMVVGYATNTVGNADGTWARYDAGGNYLNLNAINGPNNFHDQFRGITRLTDGSYYVSGHYVIGNGNSDAYVAHVSPFGYATCTAANPKNCGNKDWSECDDGKPCTRDDCDFNASCVHIINDTLKLLCDDGKYCSLNDKCTGGNCVSTVVPDCDDGNPCTGDTCLESAKGCSYTKLDGVACGSGKVCKVGVCQ